MFDQPYLFLIIAGLLLKAGGFLVRDELLLRSMVMLGTACDILFYWLQSPAIWGSVLANSVLVAINLSLITVIVIERSTLFMSAKERSAFENFKTLSPGQFRRVNRMARWRIATEETVVLNEDERADVLYFLEAEQFFVEKKGHRYEARGPAFVGEIMLLQGGAASATVIVPRGAIYAEWQTPRLRKAMSRSRPLENALIARFGHDLADKVRTSVPLTEDRRYAEAVQSPE